MRNVLIFGDGPISDFLHDELKSSCRIQNVVTNSEYVDPEKPNVKCIDDVEISLFDSAYVAIGYKNLKLKEAIFEKYKDLVDFPNFFSNVKFERMGFGIGNIVMPNAIIERNVSIGNFNMFWTNSHVCHDVKINCCNFFAAGVRIGGYSNVGSFCKFGFNSVVCDKSIVPDSTKLNALEFYK